MLLLHLLDEIAFFLHLPLNIVAMVPVVGQSGVNIAHRQMREARNDLVGR